MPKKVKRAKSETPSEESGGEYGDQDYDDSSDGSADMPAGGPELKESDLANLQFESDSESESSDYGEVLKFEPDDKSEISVLTTATPRNHDLPKEILSPKLGQTM